MSKPIRTFRMAFPILKHLAINPGKTPYAIEKEAGIDRETVLKSLKLLCTARFVKVDRKEKLGTGLVKKNYSVTPAGIVALLQGNPDHISISKQDAREIAKNHTQFLPLIFGKWGYFHEKGVEDLAYKFLMIAVENAEDEVERLASVARSEKLEGTLATDESVHRHDIYEVMLVRACIYENEGRDKWLEVIRGSNDLVTMAEKEVQRLRIQDEEGVKFWIAVLDELRGNPSGKKHHILLAGPGGEMDQEAVDKFEALVNYAQAKAIDEGKAIPSQKDVLMEMVNRAEKMKSRS